MGKHPQAALKPVPTATASNFSICLSYPEIDAKLKK
jgi:hypothetical protein